MRNPDDIKVLFLIYPILAETDDEAQKKLRMVWIRARSNARGGQHRDGDRHRFSKFPLDEPLPHLTTNGEQGSLDRVAPQ